MRTHHRIAALAVAAAALAMAGCGAGGLPAKATVSTIDRACEIVTTTTSQVDDPRGSGTKLEAQEMDSSTGDCRSVDEWEEVRSNRTKKVQGNAVVHLDYKAPQDGSYHSGSLAFTGQDDEFYDLKAGDRIDIMVAKDDPRRIWKA